MLRRCQSALTHSGTKLPISNDLRPLESLSSAVFWPFQTIIPLPGGEEGTAVQGKSWSVFLEVKFTLHD